MAQQQSPWLEAKYGWNFGEGGWNVGVDENLLKFSFLFDRNVDGVVSTLPAAVNGKAYFLTTDNRLYFTVNTTYFSCPTPKWFEFVVRGTGVTYQFNGTSAIQVESLIGVDSRLDAVELSVASLGTASSKNTEFFATTARVDVVEANAQSTTDRAVQVVGDYAAGLVLSNRNQGFRYLGDIYLPGDGITLPYTTTGVGAGEVANFRSVGDAILRTDLAAPGGAGRVGYSVETVAEALDRLDATASVLASTSSTPNTPLVSQAATLQAAWDAAAADGKPFVIDGVYWVATTPKTYGDGLIRNVGLQVPNNSVCVFTLGSAIKVIPNNQPLAYIINFYLADNFQLINPVVYGDVDEHLGVADESFHCYNIVNCTNGYIHRPKAFNAWGDGLYIGTEYYSLTNKQLRNVTVFEPYVRHCGRNCISVTSGIEVNIVRPDVGDAFRTDPKAGIDVEPEGAGACLPELRDVAITGPIRVLYCDKGVAVYLLNVQGIVSVDIGEIQATNCNAPFIGTNFVANKGSVKVAGLTVNGCTQNPVRLQWSSNGASLQFGNIHAINACAGGPGGARYSSIVSVDIDSVAQPAGELGNFTIGDIYITNTGANSVVTPFYFKDNTVAANRTLGNARIGKIYGTAALDYFYADGPVAANFLFTQKSVSSNYLNQRRPALYSEIDIIAVGFDFEFRIGDDYKTDIKLNKIDLTGAPIKVYPPVGGQFYPLSKAAGGYLLTTAPGSSLDMRFLSGVNYIQDVVTGTWTAP